MKMLFRLLVVGLPFVTSVLAEPLRVNALFSDHMVLQRDRGIRVFGVGEDGTEVVVTLDGAEAKTKVDQILAKRPGSKVKTALAESCR